MDRSSRAGAWTGALALLALVAWAQERPARMEVQRVQTVIPIEGLDPVLYQIGKEVQGKADLSLTRGRFQYLFSSPETRSAFEKEPEKYEIRLGGRCARMGRDIRGNPDIFATHDGHIYLFGTEQCRKLFLEAPHRYLEADPPRLDSSQQAVEKGRALLAKALSAIGSAERVDSIRSLRSDGSQIIETPQGKAEASVSHVLDLPGRMRLERAVGGGRLITVVTPDDAFSLFTRGERSFFNQMTAEERSYNESAALRNSPLLVLMSRNLPGFRVSAAGEVERDGASLDLCSVEVEGTIVTLGIDPSNGRILLMSSRDRAPDGSVGELRLNFSDFRTQDNLTLPFSVVATINGQPDLRSSYTIHSILLNAKPKIEDFERPVEARGK